MTEIDVVLNGKHVTSMDMSKWTSAKKNPDGSNIPGWLNKPKAELTTKGKIGLQGKHDVETGLRLQDPGADLVPSSRRQVAQVLEIDEVAIARDVADDVAEQV